jgi:peroxiredoxin
LVLTATLGVACSSCLFFRGANPDYIYFTPADAPAEDVFNFELDVSGQSDINMSWITENPPIYADIEQAVVVVYVFSGGCDPCSEIVPHVIDMYNKYTSQGVVFIGLSRDATADVAKAVVAAKGIPFHVAMDTEGVSANLGVKGMPHVVLLKNRKKVMDIQNKVNIKNDLDAKIAALL